MGHIIGLLLHKELSNDLMAFWPIRRVLHNHGRESLLERRGIFVLLVDMWRASHAFMMCVCFADRGGGDGMAGMGLMRVALRDFGECSRGVGSCLAQVSAHFVWRTRVEVGLFTVVVP